MPVPYPLEGVVSWNMTTACNYRCSYCTQNGVGDRRQGAADVSRFVEAFHALPGDWEIKLSGGEPFAHPLLFEIVEGLIRAGRRVSVVTNFSAAPADLARYAELVAPRPGVFSASLHVEYVEPGDFLDKLARFAERYPGRVVATCVATRTTLPALAGWVGRFEKRGQTLRAQPEKRDRDVFEYTPEERETLASLGGHNGTGMIEPNFSGRPCWAGARYFVVDHRGAAWRCYPARRHRKEALGNLLDGTLRLLSEAQPCRYDYCNCTVPIQRAMMEVP